MARKKKSTKVERKAQAVGVVAMLIGAVVLVSLISHQFGDDSRIVGDVDAHLSPFEIKYHNQGGMIGAYISYFLLTLVGWLAYFLPLALVVMALRLFSSSMAQKLQFSSLMLFVVGLLSTMIYNVHVVLTPTLDRDASAGGYVGRELTIIATRVIGEAGSYILLAGLVVVILVLHTPVARLLSLRLPSLPTRGFSLSPLKRVFVYLKKVLRFGWLRGLVPARSRSVESEEESEPRRRRNHTRPPEDPQPELDLAPTAEMPPETAEEKTLRSRKRAVLVKPAKPLHVTSVEYNYPGNELLAENPEPGQSVSAEELEFTARMLKETLETFGVKIQGDIEKYPGPVITRFEFKPGTGVKVNQIINLADDLALALKAKRIRIVAPIPGKAAVGIEIPNRKTQMVFLRDILQTNEFRSSDIKLPLAFGKTISGRPFVTDLAKMPHLLIAGATGSGKSVCMNVLITSLLYRLHPMQVRFIFIDPKMLELSVYKGIPHLGRPVVTNPKRAEKVLADAVAEMERRYRKLADASVRSIQDFNKKTKNVEEQLPYIIIFVDELADLMMSSSSSRTELLITRLAQMARAVGIHLILATQRPSVDVITGLIKANFPARVAFQVSSKVDSRTILDANGAEKLLGNGDMLFMSTGQPEPIRLHGAFVSSEETDDIVKFIKDQGLEMMKLEGISQKTGEVNETEVDTGDPLFKEACEVCVRHKQGSVSLLQRRLGIGYQRAARLIDKLEQAGVVSPFDGSKARDVLVDKAYIENLFAGAGQTVGSSTDSN